jgi:hypothetical protein
MLFVFIYAYWWGATSGAPKGKAVSASLMSTVVLLVTKSLINHERVMERIVITTQIFDDGQKSMMDGNCKTFEVMTSTC